MGSEMCIRDRNNIPKNVGAGISNAIVYYNNIWGNCTSVVYSPANVTETVLGDLNGDGFINMDDVILLLNYVGNPTAHPANEDAADVNCNGVVNMGDVILLLNHVNNLWSM